ncbi:hypothetical protein B0H13DRAFT_2437589 [Mycena leptocephala]|nr:hypothetical protein B0H13DRAFT_2437589 [Mycena leptocephala]
MPPSSFAHLGRRTSRDYRARAVAAEPAVRPSRREHRRTHMCTFGDNTGTGGGGRRRLRTHGLACTPTRYSVLASRIRIWIWGSSLRRGLSIKPSSCNDERRAQGVKFTGSRQRMEMASGRGEWEGSELQGQEGTRTPAPDKAGWTSASQRREHISIPQGAAATVLLWAASADEKSDRQIRHSGAAPIALPVLAARRSEGRGVAASSATVAYGGHGLEKRTEMMLPVRRGDWARNGVDGKLRVCEPVYEDTYAWRWSTQRQDDPGGPGQDQCMFTSLWELQLARFEAM